MGFGDAVSSCFLNFANFQGRARRSEFWYSMLFFTILNIVYSLIERSLLGGMSFLTGAIRLPVIIASLSVTVRRLHDTSKSGYWVMAPIVSFVMIFLGLLAGLSQNANDVAETLVVLGVLFGICSSILLIIFFCIDSVPGTNQYGFDPKGAERTGRY